MRRLLTVGVLGVLVGSGCRCGERAVEQVQARLATPDTGARTDPARLVEAVRAGNVVELKRLLEGGDPNAPVAFRLSLSELSKKDDPAAWLKVYLKYHQLLASWLFSYLDYMCPKAAANMEDDATVALKKFVGDPKSLLKKEGWGLKAPTLLHVSALLCQQPATEALLAAGAKVDAPDGQGIPPLGYVTCDAVAELLLKHGANPNSRSKKGLTPLHLAIDAPIARRLIKAGAAVDARDECGNTPLHHATLNGLDFKEVVVADEADAGELALPDHPVLRWLVKAGLRLTESLAKVLRECDVAGVLLAHGADASLKNAAGHDVASLKAKRAAASHHDWDD